MDVNTDRESSPGATLRARSPSAHQQSTTSERSLRARSRRRITATGRRVAFWTAVVLPFLYGPLVFSGLDTTAELLVVGGLVALNLLALLAGHGHKRE